MKGYKVKEFNLPRVGCFPRVEQRLYSQHYYTRLISSYNVENFDDLEDLKDSEDLKMWKIFEF